MDRTLLVRDAGTLGVAAWERLCEAALARGEARLLVARLTGADISLGRWERAQTVLTAAGLERGWVRRATGGRACAAGEGVVAVALVAPDPGWLSQERISAARWPNRAVRGILAGLTRLGAKAFYGGRDFVSVDGAQAGLLGIDLDAEGHALLTCLLAAEAHWWLPDAMRARPLSPFGSGFPPPGHVEALAGTDTRRIASTLMKEYGETFKLSLVGDVEPLESAAPIAEPPVLPLHSNVHSIPVGHAEAAAALGPDGRIERACFHGDFLADGAGLRALEAAVVGARPTMEELAPRIDAVYASGRSTVLGVDSLEVFARALVEACGG